MAQNSSETPEEVEHVDQSPRPSQRELGWEPGRVGYHEGSFSKLLPARPLAMCVWSWGRAPAGLEAGLAQIEESGISCGTAYS